MREASRTTHPNFSFEDLNIDAALRQAKLGKGYARTPSTKERLKELNEGKVTLPPHSPWQGDYTDWVADPFNDRNWRFQFHTLRWINPYLWDALAGSEDSKAEWKRIVRSWAHDNTPHRRARDEYAWMDMTDGNRAIQISIGAPLIDSDDAWYINLLVEHRNWLLEDKNIVQGNHGLHQNLGLFVVSAVLSDETGIYKAIDRLTTHILEAFDDDGLTDEGSVGYHQMNLVWWRQAQQRLELEGYSFPPEAAQRLDNAGVTMGHLLLPDGTMPQIGDGNRGKGRRGLHGFLDQVNKGTIQDTDRPLVQHYKNGFTVSRSGWGETRPVKEESHTIVRHGRDLLRHSHDDRGSVHIYTAGRRWITDGGFHSYQQNDPDRIYTKSRLAHSLVDIPAQDHDITGDVPVLLAESRSDLHSVEILDANFDTASWKRRVVFLPKQHIWVIWDRIEGANEERVQQQWLLDIGVVAEQIDETTLSLHDKRNELHMQWLGNQPNFDITRGAPKSDTKRGLIGLRWKDMKPSTSVHANFYTKNVESIVVISFQDDPRVTVELIDHEPMGSFELKLDSPEQMYRLNFQGNSTNLIPDM